MRNKKYEKKSAQSILSSVDQAAKDAYNRGDLSRQTYESLIKGGLVDRRDDGVPHWHGTVILDAAPVPPVDGDPFEVHPLSPVVEYVTEELAAPPPPPPPISDAEPSDEECKVEYTPLRTEEIRPSNTAEKAADPPAAQQEPEVPAWDGCAFLHCFGCLRLDVIQYGGRVLPDDLKVCTDDPECTIVMILCGSCRKPPKHSRYPTRVQGSDMASNFRSICLPPQLFNRSDGILAVHILTGQEVDILTTSGGVAYWDVDRIVKKLGANDRMSSIDMDKFIDGERDKSKLQSYVRGGLISFAD